MSDEELKELWQGQGFEGARTPPPEKSLEIIRAKSISMRRTLKWRDARELIACVIIVIVFAIYFVIIPGFGPRVGSLIVVGSCIFIAWKLVRARRVAPQLLADAPVKDWLRAQLQQITEQAELLRTVGWWYLLPLWLGANVFFWGMSNPMTAKWIYTLVTAVFFVFIWWLNQYARRKQLLPLQTELESLLRDDG